MSAVAEPIVARRRTRSGWELVATTSRGRSRTCGRTGSDGVSLVLTSSRGRALRQPWPLALVIDSVIGAAAAAAHLADQILPSGRYQQLAFLVFLGFVLTVLGHGLRVCRSTIDARIEQNMVLDLRSDMFAHAQRLSLTFHDATQTGQLMSQINMQPPRSARRDGVPAAARGLPDAGRHARRSRC